MKRGIRTDGRPYKTLEYLAHHQGGLNAYQANLMWGELALHSTISSLRNVHGADFIVSRRMSDYVGRPCQYFIAPWDIPRAQQMMWDARVRDGLKALAKAKEGGSDGAIED
jgi:hypothetical protein